MGEDTSEEVDTTVEGDTSVEGGTTEEGVTSVEEDTSVLPIIVLIIVPITATTVEGSWVDYSVVGTTAGMVVITVASMVK